MSEPYLDQLRAAREEFGYSPASADDEHLAELRADNERHDRMNVHDPNGTKWKKMVPRAPQS